MQRKIRKALESKYGGWWFKVWGGPFQVAGIPDLVGCVEGKFFAFEVKRPLGKGPTAIQAETMRQIIEKGGGVAMEVRTPQEALNAVKAAIQSTR